MTHTEIAWGIGLTLFGAVVGLMLTVVFLPSLQRLWTHMNRTTPLTPQTRGKLTESLAMYEMQLDRLNHLKCSTKDTLLFMFQLSFSILALLITGILGYKLLLFTESKPYLHDAIFLAFFIMADGFCIFGIVQSITLSDRKIDMAIGKAEKYIDGIRAMLSIKP